MNVVRSRVVHRWGKCSGDRLQKIRIVGMTTERDSIAGRTMTGSGQGDKQLESECA